MTRWLVASVTASTFANAEASVEGPICLLGQPPARCIEGTGAWSAVKVAALCQVKMVPMEMTGGRCEEKGFTCEKARPEGKIFAGIKEFDVPAKDGNCTSGSALEELSHVSAAIKAAVKQRFTGAASLHSR